MAGGAGARATPPREAEYRSPSLSTICRNSMAVSTAPATDCLNRRVFAIAARSRGPSRSNSMIRTITGVGGAPGITPAGITTSPAAVHRPAAPCGLRMRAHSRPPLDRWATRPRWTRAAPGRSDDRRLGGGKRRFGRGVIICRRWRRLRPFYRRRVCRFLAGCPDDRHGRRLALPRRALRTVGVVDDAARHPFKMRRGAINAKASNIARRVTSSHIRSPN